MFNFLDKHLIAEWRQSWKYFSVQVSSLCFAIAASWPLLPAESQAAILSMTGYSGMGMLAAIGFLATIIARWKSQPTMPAKEFSSLKEFGRFLSVRLSALGLLVASVWTALPATDQSALLELLPGNFNLGNTVAMLGFLSVVVGRLKSQSPVEPLDDQLS